ncbi:MAG: hypothetical protein AAF467_23800 [Actinomycetota bacterium]
MRELTPTRPLRARWLALLAALVLVAAACGDDTEQGQATSDVTSEASDGDGADDAGDGSDGDGGGADDGADNDGSTDTTSDGGDSGDSDGDGDGDGGADGGDSDGEGSGDGSGDTTDPTTEPFTGLRVVAEGPDVDGLLRWNRDEALEQNAAGEWNQIAAGPMIEMVDLPGPAVAVQREPQARIIYKVTGDLVSELLVTDENFWLELEGGGTDQNGNDVVWYQRHDEFNGSDDLQRTLRSYALNTEQVIELAVTGGFESGTSYSVLTGGTGVGNWGGEGFLGIEMVDLTTGAIAFNSDADGFACFSGEDCPYYEHATMYEGVPHGVRALENNSGQRTGAWALFQYDTGTGTDTKLLEFPGVPDAWSPEDLFLVGNTMVMSIRDAANEPLPAVAIDMTTGDSWTLPEPYWVRPDVG